MRSLKPITWIREGACIRCTSHSLGGAGYPKISPNGKTLNIARIIAQKRHAGQLSSNVVARHTCDNRWCINPAHIITGSVRENIHDAISRGRHAFSKLNKESILSIRGSSGTQSDIARKFGIDQSMVSYIINRKVWKHV